ncbi:MAG: hypothetical protein ACO1PI_00625 [Bacteroidota bacterium]
MRLNKSIFLLLLPLIVGVFFLFIIIKLTSLLSLIDNDENCIKKLSSEYSWNYCDKKLLRNKSENLFVVIESSKVDSIRFKNKNEFVVYKGVIPFGAFVRDDSLILYNEEK